MLSETEKLTLSHVFIVEDEQIVAEDLRQILLKKGFVSVSLFSSGEEALEESQRRPPDLILMDINLKKGIDGITTGERLMAKRYVPILFITAYTDEETLERAKSLRPYGYIIKPIEERELLINVEMALYRYRAERQIREAEERSQEIFDKNDTPLLLLDRRDGKLLDINRAALDLFGKSREAVLGFPPERLFGDETPLTPFREALGRLEKGVPVTCRITVPTPTDKKVLLQASAKNIHLADRDVIYVSLYDITERFQFEEQAKILQKKLIQADKMKSLGMLTSSLAHEVNNPNSFILFNVSLLRDAWQDASGILQRHSDNVGDFLLGGLPFSEMKEALPKLLSGINEGALRIKNLVDNLRDFSRNDKGSEELDDSVDILKVIRSSLVIMDYQIRKCTNNFSLDLPEALPPLKGNSQMLEQVMINLISNALQALPRKEASLSIRAFADRVEKVVSVEVVDQGVGMSSQTMNRITEPFFTTRAAVGGTGLGLYISHSIVRLHKGEMSFFSRPGVGTRVVLTFPPCREEDEK
ncbi:MAG TPA: response regulator [Candidatus Aminicenantes bacterium]|nr:response regulator [Candidatus Aminicenantes bacterium]